MFGVVPFLFLGEVYMAKHANRKPMMSDKEMDAMHRKKIGSGKKKKK